MYTWTGEHSKLDSCKDNLVHNFLKSTLHLRILFKLIIYILCIHFRLKTCEVVISGLDDAKQLVSDYEQTLASHEGLPSDLISFREFQHELTVRLQKIGLHVIHFKMTFLIF